MSEKMYLTKFPIHAVSLSNITSLTKKKAAKCISTSLIILSIKEDAERPYAIAQFGEILSNAIIQKKLISITSCFIRCSCRTTFQRLFAMHIKREQIANQESLTNEYSYTYFQKIVRFKLKNKKKNLQLIQESLSGICR